MGPIVQAGLVGGAVLMCSWADVPLPINIGLGLLGLGILIPSLIRQSARGNWSKYGVLAGWICTLGLVLCLLAGRGPRYSFASFCDYYFGIVAGLLAVAMWIAGVPEVAPKSRWLGLALTWTCLANFLWLGGAFLRNERWAFALGLFLFAGLLVLLKLEVHFPFWAVQGINTLVLLAIGLPILDWVMHPSPGQKVNPASLREYYSYRGAKRDRDAFAQWWNYYNDQIGQMFEAIRVLDTNAPAPIHLKRNSHATLVDSQITINSRGFRGREIPENKGDAYRIVALGESTTFGYTINAGDKPWPELLEQMIRDRLKLRHPVEVINAGLPAASLVDNLKRFPTEILPVQPDMIICYHGINGFSLLDQGMPPLTGAAPPPYRPRPLQIWADAEYRLRLMRYLRQQTIEAPRLAVSNLMDCRYAAAYRRLIDICRTNHIRLVLANFPLAVNEQSPPELVEFFRPRHRLVRPTIKANATFTLMMQEIARRNPDVSLVDTHPHLDGEEEKYLDLMHVTQEGDRQLAETFFAAIKSTLKSELQ